MSSYTYPSNGSYNGSHAYGAPQPNQQQTQQTQQPPQLQQPPPLQPPHQQQHQQQQQQQYQNPFPSQPATSLAPPQQQMTMVAAPPGSQPGNQWSVQPPQQQQQQQQQPYGTSQNLGMPNSQFVASIPPYQGQNLGQAQGQRQVTPPVTHQNPQPPYGAPQTYQPSLQQQQPQQQAQQHPPQQQPPPPPVPTVSTDDFFGDFNSERQVSVITEYTGRQNSYENDNVSVLSKNTADHRKSGKLSPLDDPNFAPAPPPVPGLESAKSIAQHVSPSAGPLPDFDKVTHSGYSLARISFRSILIKKWKQVFWVTYGASKLLIFRSHADFEDWMVNPYLTKGQRDFLVKLEIDFIEDAYKVNVRGYQVTNIRCKNYQNKLLHQFKMERWMEYGPTIAAAFASQNEKDVQTLRIILSEMMKRCPQDRGMGQDNQNDNSTRPYNHANSYANDGQNYNDGAGGRYMSGSASVGAGSESGSVRTGRSMGGASTGPMDRVRNLSQSMGGYRR